jgi:CubicO group peptidase (beta-lactamase class C family)
MRPILLNAGILSVYILLLTTGQISGQTTNANGESAADPRIERLDDYLQRVEAFGFSGRILLAEKGKILFSRSYGFADRERQKRFSSDTAFNIASLTKQFTAAAILHLESKGKLKTDDPIGRHLENVPAEKTGITIHQLLTHTSGLVRGGDGRNNTTRAETVAKILGESSAAKPGEKFIYSNNGYHLLAAVIEKAGGRPYGEYLEENLFKPVGMLRTAVYQDERWTETDVAQSYNEWKKLNSFLNWKKVWNYGSGSVVSTPEDLYRWISALYENKILPKHSLEKLFQKHTPTGSEDVFYGYGWYLTETADGKKLIYHGGDNYGYHCELRRFAEDERVIIVFANYEMFEPDGAAVQKRIIGDQLAAILSGKEYRQPPSFKRLAADALAKYAGVYQTSDGARFVVSKGTEHLQIAAEGQKAIDALAGYKKESAEKYARETALTERIISDVAAGKPDAVKKYLASSDYDFYIPFLIDQLREFEAKFGKLKDYRVQGTSAFPWNYNDYRTYVRLRFEQGVTDFFLGWDDGKLYDLTTATGRPFPLITPLVAQTETEFFTYEFIGNKPTKLSFQISDDRVRSLSIKTGETTITANRVKNAASGDAEP